MYFVLFIFEGFTHFNHILSISLTFPTSMPPLLPTQLHVISSLKTKQIKTKTLAIHWVAASPLCPIPTPKFSDLISSLFFSCFLQDMLHRTFNVFILQLFALPIPWFPRMWLGSFWAVTGSTQLWLRPLIQAHRGTHWKSQFWKESQAKHNYSFWFLVGIASKLDHAVSKAERVHPSVPPEFCLVWVPVLTSLDDEKQCKSNTPFPSQNVLFGYGVSCQQQKP